MITATTDLGDYVRADGLVSIEQIIDRQARCSCGRTTPSVGTEHHRGLPAVFEYRGEGSKWATTGCGHPTDTSKIPSYVLAQNPNRVFVCGYNACAHANVNEVNSVTGHPASITDHDFTPRGAAEFDSFYCGCRGWE